MSFKRNYRGKGRGKFDRKESGLTMTQETFVGGNPTKPAISQESSTIAFKAYRDLKFTGAIETKADPNTEAAKGSYPYRILNNNNKIVDANYPGYDNISGNSIVKMQNSLNTQFFNLVDSICMIKRLNYAYLAIDKETTSNAVNIAYNIEMTKSITEALSKGYSTMLTQLAFYTDYSNSDMPRGKAGSPLYISDTNNGFPEATGTAQDKAAASDTYGKLGALVFYQTALQNIVAPLAKYTELMSEEQELMNVSYRREAPILQQLFGQLHKKAFIAQLNAIGTAVLGEYFDTNWWTQMNTLRHIPSRKSCDMNNPMVTVCSSHIIPNVRLYSGGTNPTIYFDTTSTNASTGFRYAQATLMDPENYSIQNYENITLEQIVLLLTKMLDYHYVLTWSRRVNTGVLNNATQYVTTASAYYRQITNCLDILSWFAARFTSSMSEIRTFLDKLVDSGLVYWKKGIKFNIDRVTSVDVTYNQITADILKNSLAGSQTMHYDDQTKRWACTTEWNMYTGISEYDRKSGGAFFTFSLRNIDRNYTEAGTSVVHTIQYHDSEMLLPILFDSNPVTYSITQSEDHAKPWAEQESDHYASANVRACNRLGAKFCLGYQAYTAANFLASPILARLNPTFNYQLAAKCPNVNMANLVADNGSMTPEELARVMNMISKVLTQTCGYCAIYRNNINYEMADPDILAFIDLQIEDVSNEMIQYARNYSPFRVATPDGKRTMGFGK